jgi:hypothetical protein
MARNSYCCTLSFTCYFECFYSGGLYIDLEFGGNSCIFKGFHSDMEASAEFVVFHRKWEWTFEDTVPLITPNCASDENSGTPVAKRTAAMYRSYLEENERRRSNQPTERVVRQPGPYYSFHLEHLYPFPEPRIANTFPETNSVAVIVWTSCEDRPSTAIRGGNDQGVTTVCHLRYTYSLEGCDMIRYSNS